MTVTGTPASGVLDPTTADHTAPVTADPELVVTKAATSSATTAGETIAYAFTVVNTGTVTISDLVVTDPKCATPPSLDDENVVSDSVF